MNKTCLGWIKHRSSDTASALDEIRTGITSINQQRFGREQGGEESDSNPRRNIINECMSESAIPDSLLQWDPANLAHDPIAWKYVMRLQSMSAFLASSVVTVSGELW
ncbi:15289_t:CDS:2 [Acaulospora colombiana]|uniref:15289_t:CDS:1 n=1 Tax=Acaulospora colombiana TaxID=27376 RepID=A0ACA9PB05_9GLOM|nr:15289_t:CDS:2 [Acaulospora colombiana]